MHDAINTCSSGRTNSYIAKVSDNIQMPEKDGDLPYLLVNGEISSYPNYPDYCVGDFLIRENLG